MNKWFLTKVHYQCRQENYAWIIDTYKQKNNFNNLYNMQTLTHTHIVLKHKVDGYITARRKYRQKSLNLGLCFL